MKKIIAYGGEYAKPFYPKFDGRKINLEFCEDPYSFFN